LAAVRSRLRGAVGAIMISGSYDMMKLVAMRAHMDNLFLGHLMAGRAQLEFDFEPQQLKLDLNVPKRGAKNDGLRSRVRGFVLHIRRFVLDGREMV